MKLILTAVLILACTAIFGQTISFSDKNGENEISVELLSNNPSDFRNTSLLIGGFYNGTNSSSNFFRLRHMEPTKYYAEIDFGPYSIKTIGTYFVKNINKQKMYKLPLKIVQNFPNVTQYYGKTNLDKLVSVGIRGGVQVINDFFKTGDAYNDNVLIAGVSLTKNRFVNYGVEESAVIISSQNTLALDLLYHTNGKYFTSILDDNRYNGAALKLMWERQGTKSERKGRFAGSYGFGFIFGNKLDASNAKVASTSYCINLAIGYNFKKKERN
jgi:hypothetical protein